jgi:multiple sugar transport system ATP-binding protein/alpha-glucoside transport system ATP-binding protein
MTRLTLESCSKSYGALSILHEIDLMIESGEFVVFVGPSGCGKSTLLRMIAGLEEISSGVLKFDDRIVNNESPSERGVSMVFQSYALYPHMNVRENTGFGLKLAGQSKEAIDKAVERVANLLQLTAYLDRLPKQLSGGQRQRVAIGRAIVRNPAVFLFDEPLSNLDAALRVATRVEIAKLHDRMPQTTMIYVTHDQVEAMTLADRIVVLNGGKIEQVGKPLELYERPANLFVAKFIGSPAMNILPCSIDAEGSVAYRGARELTPRRYGAGGTDYIGIRPEDVVIADDGAIEGRVDLVEQLGEFQLLYVDVGSDEPMVAKVARDSSFKIGETVKLGGAAEHWHVFGSDGGGISPLEV